MRNIKHLVYLFFVFVVSQAANAQLGFSHEIGVIAGPLQFKSDFGSRNDGKTNFGNTGYGVGLVHYINFSYRSDCNCYTTDTYFNDHFKIRNEISYNKTNLEHLGRWVHPEKTSDYANKLRDHTGVAENIDIGTELEFFPFSIRSFQAFGYRIAPFVSIGVHYTSFNPKAATTYGDGNVFNPDNIYDPWVEDYKNGLDVYPINVDGGGTWTGVGSFGFRYKIDRMSDLMLNLRWQYYFNDWVDGLGHTTVSNKHHEWLLWLNVGYIYHLN